MGLETGVDLEALAETGRWLAALLGRPTGSKVGKALAGVKNRGAARRGTKAASGAGRRTATTAISRRIGSPILSPTHCSAARAGPRVRFAYPGYAGRVAWGWKPEWIWRRWRRRGAGWPHCWAARRAARWERRWRE